jgi:hypothetical protein
MGRAGALIAAAAVWGLLSGCARQPVQNQMPPALLDEAVLALGVDPEQDFRPLTPVQRVTAETPEFVAWIRLKNVSKVYTLRWLWYAPDGSLYYDSGDSIVQPTGLYHPYVSSWQRLPIANWQAADLPGEWRVVVQLNQDELAVLRFVVESRPEHVVGDDGKSS